MAVELVPKEKIGKKISLDLFKLSFYFLTGLALGLTLSFLFLHFSESRIEERLFQIESTLAQWRTKEIEALEEKVFDTQEKIETYENLLDLHKKPTLFFDFIAKACHKYVRYLDIELDLKAGTASLQGKTEGFSDLRKQILILENIDLIQDVELERVSFNEQRGIDFSLVLRLDPVVFKEEFEQEIEDLEDELEKEGRQGQEEPAAAEISP